MKYITAWKRGEFVRYGEKLERAKIMAVSDNWIMARFPRCKPFTISFKEATENWLKAATGKQP